MHGITRRYQVEPSAVDEVARRVEQGLVPIIRAIPGFVSYGLNDFGSGEIRSLGVFQGKASAETAEAAVTAWLREHLGALVLDPPEVAEVDVRVYDTMPGRRPTIGVMRIYRGVDPANVDEIARRVRDGLPPILRSVPGYVSYVAGDMGHGVIASASSFTDHAAVDESSRRASAWLTANLSDIIPNAPQSRTCRTLFRYAGG